MSWYLQPSSYVSKNCIPFIRLLVLICMPNSPIPTNDFDGAWKEALHLYLPAFAELCFPNVSAAIDWSKPIEFLDKEFEKITVDATSGKRFVDCLVRVISLVILADDRPRWKPAFYEHNVLGCKTRFEYPVCKLLDLAKQWSELEKLKSPAATVIMAHVRALQTHGDMRPRLEHKWELLRRLYEQGLRRNEILTLYRLLDWLLRLPKPEALIFKERVISYEKERTMEFITDMEQRGLEKGLNKVSTAKVERSYCACSSSSLAPCPKS